MANEWWKKKDGEKVEPVDVIVSLIADNNQIFGEAFRITDTAFFTQTGRRLNRRDVAREVLSELEKLCK